MKKSIRVLALVLFMIMALSVLTMGYARITRQLFFAGDISVEAIPFFGVYITEAERVYTAGVSGYSHEYIKPTNLKTAVTPAQNAEPSVTYRVTVHNNTDVSYWYLGIGAERDYGANNLIDQNDGIFITTKDHLEDTSATFDKNDWIPPQTYRTFYVTYRFGARARGTACDNMVNFRFGLHMDSVQDEFLRLLNDKTSANGYQYIAESFDDKYAENGSTVIGNIGDDTAIFDAMFGPDMKINVGGVEKSVTVMIERKNVDSNVSSGDAYAGGGPAGCEYTIYLTTDSLGEDAVTVYAVSYTCDANGVWRQIGELYEGTCETDTYEDSGKAAMNISTWDATPKIYQVTNDISYKVGYEQGTEYDKYDTIEQLMSAKDQEFYNAVNNNSSKLLIPACLIVYSYRHHNGQWIESDNPYNKYNPGYDLLKAAFDKIKPYCYIGNGAQEVKIQNASTLSRAELIRLLEAVQQAYDYYLSVNET
ncbi:MAG: hypothetical protein IJC99_06560 [Clostridia bacterium]|nr:hypothetical protein [Clostridia bacterium]